MNAAQQTALGALLILVLLACGVRMTEAQCGPNPGCSPPTDCVCWNGPISGWCSCTCNHVFIGGSWFNIWQCSSGCNTCPPIPPPPTYTFTATVSPTPTITPTATITPTSTNTPTATPTPSATPTDTMDCRTITPTPTTTPTPTPCIGCCQCGAHYPDAFNTTDTCYGGICFPGEVAVGGACVTPSPTPVPCNGCCECGPHYPQAFDAAGGACEGTCVDGAVAVGNLCLTPTPTPIPCGGDDCCQCGPHYPDAFTEATPIPCEGECIPNAVVITRTPGVNVCVTRTPTPLAADDCCGCSIDSPQCRQGTAAGHCDGGVVIKGICGPGGICTPATPVRTATPTPTPTDTPFPTGVPTLTFTATTIPTTTPTAALSICGSTAPFNGNVGGYDGGNALCVAATGDLLAHVCSSQNMLDIIKGNGEPLSGSGWVVEGPPGSSAVAAPSPGQGTYVADCNGLTNSDAGHYGRIWVFDFPNGGVSLTTRCNSNLPYYCCCF